MKNKSFGIKIKGRLVELHSPLVMGIINITPDSFFEGSRFVHTDQILEKAGEMLKEGAWMLDVGGASTRPGAESLPLDIELERVIPAIEVLRKAFPEAILSIDTFRAVVADAAVKAGADIINDVGAGLWDEGMLNTMQALKVPVIIMHTKGRPATMQQHPKYDAVVTEVFDFLAQRLNELHRAGVHDVWIDPGFGFGKLLEHNYQILADLNTLNMLDAPLLVGLSRKSMATRLLNIPAAEALNASTALHMAALIKGADILRVHDVKEAVECIQIFNTINMNNIG